MHVVLVEPEIHWNTGNAGRTCLAVGAQLHLVQPLGFEIDDRAVRRAGLDYWPKVAPKVWDDWSSFESALPDLGPAYFVSPDGERDYFAAEFSPNPVLIFGRESAGFDSSVRDRYRDRLIRIPMVADSVRSINLSTCVGIVAYEARRQLGGAQSGP